MTITKGLITIFSTYHIVNVMNVVFTLYVLVIVIDYSWLHTVAAYISIFWGSSIERYENFF
jgi:hypothetical protein